MLFIRRQKNKKKSKKIAEHRTYAHAAAKANAQKPNAAARRKCNRQIVKKVLPHNRTMILHVFFLG